MVHQTAVDAEFGQVTDLDTVEVLDPPDAAADHAEQPLRLLPLASRPVGTTEYADAGREAVGGADLLVQLHEALGHRGQPPVLALHLVQPAAQPARQHVDPAADADDGLLGRRGAVELLLHGEQRGPQDLAQRGAQLRARVALLAGLGQDVVDGLTVPQSRDSFGEVAVSEPDDDGLLERDPLLRRAGPVSDAGLVRLGVLGEPGLEEGGLLTELCLQGGALGGESLFPAAHLGVPLLGLLGLGGAEVVVRTAELGPGPDEEPYAGGTGDGDRGTREGRGYLDLIRSRHCGGDGSGS